MNGTTPILDNLVIITPCFDSAQSILASVHSSLNELKGKGKLIVVDDCSSDDSYQYLSQLRYENLRVIRLNENRGPAAARNIGILSSQEQYITFLDADDIWIENSLENLIKCYLTYSPKMILQGQYIERVYDENEKDWIVGAHRWGTRLPGAIFPSKIFKAAGLLDENLRIGEDTDFWLRLRRLNIPVIRIPKASSYYTRRHTKIDALEREEYYKSLLQAVARNRTR